MRLLLSLSERGVKLLHLSGAAASLQVKFDL